MKVDRSVHACRCAAIHTCKAMGQNYFSAVSLAFGAVFCSDGARITIHATRITSAVSSKLRDNSRFGVVATNLNENLLESSTEKL